MRQQVLTAAMRIGDHVIYRERPYVLRGLDPMGVSGRRALLEDVESGELVEVPYDEVHCIPDGCAGSSEVFAADP